MNPAPDIGSYWGQFLLTQVVLRFCFVVWFLASTSWSFACSVKKLQRHPAQSQVLTLNRSSSSLLHAESSSIFPVQEFGNNGDEDGGDGLRHRRRWIVVVDDEEAIRTSVSRFLASSLPHFYRVTSCDSAVTVLKLLRQQQQQHQKQEEASASLLPDVIVADVRMPGMTGLDLLHELRRSQQNPPSWATIPVILLTAKSKLNDRLAGYSAGADVYLPKPFDPRELLAIVESLITRKDQVQGTDIGIQDLQRDLQEIKSLLKQGGAGAGSDGWIENTGIFLAPDERQVLELLCQGKTNKEIAAHLFLSTRRVEQLLTTLYRKVQVKNRTELVRWAIATGQVEV